METSIIVLIVGICIFMVPLVILVPKSIKQVYAFILSIGFAVCTMLLVVAVFENGPLYYEIIRIPVIGYLAIQIDLLSAFFILMVNFTCILAGFYAIGSMRDYKNAISLNMYFIAFNFLHVGMLLVCMFSNLFTFLISWELMSIASFILIVFNYEKKDTLKVGMNYLIQMHIGVVVLLFASLYLYKVTGEFSFEALSIFFAKEPVLPLFLLFFIGFGFKAGIVPLHTWLTPAYEVCPSQVLSVMSGVMMKMALYGILRVMLFVPSNHLEIGIIIVIVGMTSALYGILNAVAQKSLKKMLGFSSIENIGIILMGLGIGFIGIGINNSSMAFLGLIAGLLHIFNHSLFKSLLFLGVGSVQVATKTTNIEYLGALIKRMPLSSVLFLVGVLAICGLPPLNGFISEFLLFQGILKGLNATNVSIEVLLLITMSCLALLGGLSIYAFAKAFGLSFLGVARSEKASLANEVNWFMLIPQFIIVAILVSISIFSSFYYNFFSLLVSMYLDIYDHQITMTSVIALENDTFITLVFIFMIVGLYILRSFKVKQNKASYGASSWGCGYLAGSPKMQYTSTSFASYVLKLAQPLLGYQVRYKQIPKNDIFPLDRKFKKINHDVLEKDVLEKVIHWSENGIKKFAFIETGKTQSYIMYAFMFILVLFLITFFNII